MKWQNETVFLIILSPSFVHLFYLNQMDIEYIWLADKQYLYRICIQESC